MDDQSLFILENAILISISIRLINKQAIAINGIR